MSCTDTACVVQLHYARRQCRCLPRADLGRAHRKGTGFWRSNGFHSAVRCRSPSDYYDAPAVLLSSGERYTNAYLPTGIVIRTVTASLGTCCSRPLPSREASRHSLRICSMNCWPVRHDAQGKGPPPSENAQAVMALEAVDQSNLWSKLWAIGLLHRNYTPRTIKIVAGAAAYIASPHSGQRGSLRPGANCATAPHVLRSAVRSEGLPGNRTQSMVGFRILPAACKRSPADECTCSTIGIPRSANPAAC